MDKAGAGSVAAATFWAFFVDQYASTSYIFIAPFVAPLFFPSGNYFVSILVFFVTYGSQLMVRPVGSALWGVRADRIGRKKLLTYTSLAVTLLLAAIGAFPDYAQAGVVAPLLLELDSLALGLVTGVLTASSHTMGFEQIREKRRGLMGGLLGSAPHASAVAGSIWFTVLAASVGVPAIVHFWWRVYFGVGILGLVLPVFIHFRVRESALFERVREKGMTVKDPLKQVFSPALRRHFLQAFLAASLWGIFIAGFGPLVPTYVFTTTSVPRASIGELVLGLQAGSMVTTWVGGFVSQYLGRKRTMLLGSILISVYAFSFHGLAGVGSDVAAAVGYTTLIGMVQGIGGGAYISFIAESFPTQLRGTGMAMSINLGQSTVGLFGIAVASLLSFGLTFPVVAVTASLLVALATFAFSVQAPETRGSMATEEAALAGT